MAMFACAGLMLMTSPSQAVYFTFSGKFTSNRGKIINIPVVGNTPCAPMILMTGPGGGLGAIPTSMGGKLPNPGTMTPTMHPVLRPANTQPQMAVTTMFAGTGRDLLCVKHVANKLVNTTGGKTVGGKGGGFVMPNNVWTKPLPPYLRAVEVKYAPPVEQLATSFKITGPAAVRTTGPMGTMRTGMNTAAFHAFKRNAYLTQTGRKAGGNFTWCPKTIAPPGTMGTPAKGKGITCNNINQGGRHLLVKYTAGANKYGGTMAYIITTGARTSSLAVGVGGGAVGFQILAGMGSQPTGRGYADFLTDHLIKGPIWGVQMRTTVTPGPVIGPQKLITSVAFPAGTFPSGTNFNFGFPFTTGKVVVRNYGTRTTTLTAVGSDARTAMGAGNLSLVAGGLAIARLVGAADQPTPEILTMRIALPEPGATLQLVAGIAALLGVAVWRSRRAR
jgi:hypothetical protein